MNPYDELKGMTAVVTGGNRGVGAGIVQVFGRCGMRVVIAARDAALNEQAAEEVTRLGGEGACVSLDVSDEQQVRAMAEFARNRFGQVDVLVNNAGLDPRDAWDDISVEAWDRVQAVNVRGYYLCAKHLAPPMIERRFGRVVNITSSTVWEGNVGALHYVTSKAANIGFTRALAREFDKTGVTVNAIAPGAVETPKEAELGDPETIRRALAGMLAAQLVEGRLQAADVGWTAAFLCTQSARFLTGQTINLDGGRRFH